MNGAQAVLRAIRVVRTESFRWRLLWKFKLLLEKHLEYITQQIFNVVNVKKKYFLCSRKPRLYFGGNFPVNYLTAALLYKPWNFILSWVTHTFSFGNFRCFSLPVIFCSQNINSLGGFNKGWPNKKCFWENLLLISLAKYYALCTYFWVRLLLNFLKTT